MPITLNIYDKLEPGFLKYYIKRFYGTTVRFQQATTDKLLPSNSVMSQHDIIPGAANDSLL